MPIPPEEFQSLVNQAVIFTLAAMAAVAVAMWRGCFAKGVLADAPLNRPFLRLPDIAIAIILLQVSMLGAMVLIIGEVDPDTHPIAYARGILIAQVVGYVLPMVFLLARLVLPVEKISKSLKAAKGAKGAQGAQGAQGAADFANVAPLSLLPELRRFGLGKITLAHLKSAFSGLLLAMPAVMAASALAIFVRVLQGQAPPESGHQLLALLNKSDQTGLLLALLCGSAVIVAPIGEEIIYRGIMQTSLINTLGKHMRPVVLLISSALFALVHLGGVPNEMLPALFVLGIILGWLYETTGSLWPGIVLHALFNAINIALATVEVLHETGTS